MKIPHKRVCERVKTWQLQFIGHEVFHLSTMRWLLPLLESNKIGQAGVQAEVCVAFGIAVAIPRRWLLPFASDRRPISWKETKTAQQKETGHRSCHQSSAKRGHKQRHGNCMLKSISQTKHGPKLTKEGENYLKFSGISQRLRTKGRNGNMCN